MVQQGGWGGATEVAPDSDGPGPPTATTRPRTASSHIPNSPVDGAPPLKSLPSGPGPRTRAATQKPPTSGPAAAHRARPQAPVRRPPSCVGQACPRGQDVHSSIQGPSGLLRTRLLEHAPAATLACHFPQRTPFSHPGSPPPLYPGGDDPLSGRII
ncbi:hypothetical protein NDU88_005653 [Pleurodeles waltl]|uniref:Uncharacterized protein n=1 Tax=Pleurodeles waltl TaxID=8319 RepID=A0AAV7LNE0_PLEWA|nr:hypothetical protein NDU88_005653 [Pleurodeles waltl]